MFRPPSLLVSSSPNVDAIAGMRAVYSFDNFLSPLVSALENATSMAALSLADGAAKGFGSVPAVAACGVAVCEAGAAV